MEIDFSKLTRNRADVFLKLPLARSLLSDYRDPEALSIYFNHLWILNGFTEATPVKKNSRDFLDSFSDLSKFYKDGRFERLENPIVVAQDKSLVNGSHRTTMQIAAQQVFGLRQSRLNMLVTEDLTSDNYDVNYFASKGVSFNYLRRSNLERINLFREYHSSTLLIYPVAAKFLDEILAIIWRRNYVIQSTTKLIVDTDLLSKIVALTYARDGWANTEIGVEEKVNEVGSSGTLYCINLQELSLEQLKELKTEIRYLWKNEFQGVHITDTWEESFSIYSTLTDKKSLDFLAELDLLLFISLIPKYSLIFTNLNSSLKTPFDFAIGGSQLLEIMGVRTASDIDILINSKEPTEFQKITVDVANSYVDKFNLDSHSLINRSRNHIWLFGMKFVTLENLEVIWLSRNEEKDLHYLRDIRAFKMGSKSLYRSGSKDLIQGLDRDYLEKTVSEKYLLIELIAQNDSRLTNSAKIDIQRDELIQQRDELIQQRDELIQQRDELLKSTIWKLTTPIRWFINLIKL